MRAPVVLVAAALTVAILLVASLVIATGTRGENGRAVIGKASMQQVLPSLRSA